MAAVDVQEWLTPKNVTIAHNTHYEGSSHIWITPRNPKQTKLMKATFTYKEGPEKHVLPSFWHMQGQIYFFLKSICIILRWVTVISHMIQITTYLCTCSFKHFIFAPTTRGLKCFTQFQCKTVQFGELMSWLPFRKSHTACPQCCTTHWKKSFSGALKYCFTRSH